MAGYIIQDTTLTGIANAIRAKDGTSDPIATEDMADHILAIPTGGGGGMVMPEFTEEKIVDNTGLATSFTFTKDYHDYDMLRIVLDAPAYSPRTAIQYAVPEGIDSAFTYSGNKINFNEMGAYPNSNQYGCYTQSGLTWTRYAVRNVTIKEIYGMTFTAGITKTLIYEKKATNNNSVSPTPPEGKTFLDFDAIIYMSCHSDQTETQFGQQLYIKPTISLIGESYYGKFTDYNNANSPQLITKTSIGNLKYFYVMGLNFS